MGLVCLQGLTAPVLLLFALDTYLTYLIYPVQVNCFFRRFPHPLSFPLWTAALMNCSCSGNDVKPQGKHHSVSSRASSPPNEVLSPGGLACFIAGSGFFEDGQPFLNLASPLVGTRTMLRKDRIVSLRLPSQARSPWNPSHLPRLYSPVTPIAPRHPTSKTTTRLHQIRTRRIPRRIAARPRSGNGSAACCQEGADMASLPYTGKFPRFGNRSARVECEGANSPVISRSCGTRRPPTSVSSRRPGSLPRRPCLPSLALVPPS